MECSKVKHTCGSIKGFAKCIKYEKEVPSFSELFGNDCKDIEQVAEDLYEILGKLKQDADVSGLLNGCITFTGTKTLSSVIEDMYLKICDLEQRLNDQQELITELQQA